MKSYTDLEQSYNLAEFLPVESADCFWDYDGLQKYHRINWFEEGYDKVSQLRLDKNNVCAWSLAALFSIVRQELFDGEYIINITEGANDKWIISYDPPYDISSYLSVSGDNLIDCCVEMIIKLKERNML